MGDVSLTLILTEECNRACSHCMADGKPNRRHFDFDKLEDVLFQIKKTIKVNPDFFSERIGISGGEPLLYSYNGNDLGDVVDILSRKKMKYWIITRGWTDQEQKNNHIIFRNYSSLQGRSGLNHVSISFDVYSFRGNGDGKKSFEMARNAINGFKDFKVPISIRVSVSAETMERSYNTLNFLMDSMGYKLYDNQERKLISYANKRISKILIDFCKKENEIIIFAKNNDGHEIMIDINGITLRSGRAINLKENSIYNIKGCDLAKWSPHSFGITPDLSVVPCCGGYFTHIIGSLERNILPEILNEYDKNFLGYEYLEKAFRKQKKFKNICNFCRQNISKYVPAL